MFQARPTAPIAAATPPILHSLKPWVALTRYGMPQFMAIRRPFTYNGVTFPIGAVIPFHFAITPQRLRQFYQQRLLAPILDTIVAAPPKGRPASEAIIPPSVLEQQALEAAEGEGMVGLSAPMTTGGMPEIEILLNEIDDLEPAVAPPAPRTNKTNKTNKRKR